MEQITENYVSFEVAKLLKPLYEFKSNLVYLEDKFITTDTYAIMQGKKYFYRPTQALVVKWLRIKHNIQINTISCIDEPEKQYFNSIVSYLFKEEELFRVQLVKSPEEATEAALLYCLKNLI